MSLCGQPVHRKASSKHADLLGQLSETDLGSFVIAGKSTPSTASSLQLALLCICSL